MNTTLHAHRAMKVTVTGTGYVGLVTGACLADAGHQVICLDLDPAKVDQLNSGRLPIHEPGLAEVVLRATAAGRLHFTAEAAFAVAHGDIQLIAVDTPAAADGSADLRQVVAAAENIGRHRSGFTVVATKSTVPVGTAERVQAIVAGCMSARGETPELSVCANPEFLKEGSAVADFTRPDRIVLGTDDPRAAQLMRALYAPFLRDPHRLLVMDVRSAEFTKYAANALLAARISLMNELAGMAELLGADIEQVRAGVGSDPRIGQHTLRAGVGYGGACLPKDVKALVHTAVQLGTPARLLTAVDAVNTHQQRVLVRKVHAAYGDDLRDKTFAVWGLAFKPDTNDMREAASVPTIMALRACGATIQAFDPAAMPASSSVMPEGPGLAYAHSAMGALEGAHALLVLTEWAQFRSPDFAAIANLLIDRTVFDGRNLYAPEELQRHGLSLVSIGRR